MIVLVVGSGGREHALARKMNEDPAVEAIHCAPGNPGTAKFATNHEIDPLDGVQVAKLATEIGANLVVVGPEGPLVAGVADQVREAGIACFGPSAEAAQLEGSKAFAKEVMQTAGVPTAGYRVCETEEELKAALEEFGAPHVVKNDGLAAGKGVVVTDDFDKAMAHGLACGKVVVEEFLDGPEASLFVITDGKKALPLQPAQDFKRVGEEDAGPNTGGMGAYTPLNWAPKDLVDEVMKAVVKPTLKTMRKRGTPFTGLLYVGLALTSKGPKVVEFNARFGDPETQAVLAMLKSPLAQVLYAAATGKLGKIKKLDWAKGSALCVVVAAEGYPGTPKSGGAIVLPPDAKNAWVIQAGTGTNSAGELVAKGGRVLNVVARGKHLIKARKRAYRMIDDIDFPDGFWRRDIARNAAQREKESLGD